MWCCLCVSCRIFFIRLAAFAIHSADSHVIFNKYFYWELKYTFHSKWLRKQSRKTSKSTQRSRRGGKKKPENLFSWYFMCTSTCMYVSNMLVSNMKGREQDSYLLGCRRERGLEGKYEKGKTQKKSRISVILLITLKNFRCSRREKTSSE